MTTRAVDCIVIGAGLAGLSAARILRRAGRSVAVVEARDRVGGRTYTTAIGGTRLDLGGQWIGPRQRRMQALCREYGLATFATFHSGRKILDLGGRLSTYSGSIPSMPALSLLSFALAEKRMEAQRRRVPAHDPAAAPRARRLDALSVETWKRRLLWTERTRGVFDAAFRVVFGAETSEVSLLHFLAYCNAGGGFSQLVEVEGAAQESRFVNGAQAVAEAIAGELGDALHLASPVRSVEWSDSALAVHSDRVVHRAPYAICATPPALLRRIHFDPVLPAALDQLLQRLPMGSTIKFQVLYERPFWRDAGFSGEVVCDGSLISVTYDNTTHDGQAALVGFIVGEAGRHWGGRDVDDRRAAVLSALRSWFGPAAAQPLLYEDKDWNADPWSGGCPVGTWPPGAITTAATGLAVPVGRLHFANTETASEWMGYMEGAVQSGERAAAEVLARFA